MRSEEEIRKRLQEITQNYYYDLHSGNATRTRLVQFKKEKAALEWVLNDEKEEEK